MGRGLSTPVMITTDGAPGLIRAVEEVYARSLRQRCLVHKIRSVIGKVPLSARDEVKAAVQAAYYAPSQEIADNIAAEVLKNYQRDYPSAMNSFQEDWEACLAYMRCPQIHHKRIRTTNLLERSFLEHRRRTKVIPRFFTERSCLKLVFATLWQASQRWQGVRMSEFELHQLDLVRQELGLPQKSEAPPNRRPTITHKHRVLSLCQIANRFYLVLVRAIRLPCTGYGPVRPVSPTYSSSRGSESGAITRAPFSFYSLTGRTPHMHRVPCREAELFVDQAPRLPT